MEYLHFLKLDFKLRSTKKLSFTELRRTKVKSREITNQAGFCSALREKEVRFLTIELRILRCRDCPVFQPSDLPRGFSGLAGKV